MSSGPTLRERKKTKRFDILMAVVDKKIKLEEKKSKLEEKNVKITAASKD